MDEAELIRRAQEGDHAAFEGLMRMHERRILALIRTFIRTPDDAADVFQEIWLRVFMGMKRFRLEATFYTWLYRITVNRCITWHDQYGRREKLHSRPVESVDDDDEWLERTIFLQGIRKSEETEDHHKAAQLQKIWAAVETLNAKQRLIFSLRYQHGLQVKEIGEIFDMPEGTVKILAFRAVRHIRDQLKDEMA